MFSMIFCVHFMKNYDFKESVRTNITSLAMFIINQCDFNHFTQLQRSLKTFIAVSCRRAYLIGERILYSKP